LNPPGIKRLKLKCDTLLSTSAFKFNVRRYSTAQNLMERWRRLLNVVGWCRLKHVPATTE
jgi:hypothetical protein